MNNLKKSDTRKIQLTVAINFISSKDNDEEHVIHSKGDTIEVMINDKANFETKKYQKIHKVILKFFRSFLNRYQNCLETSMTDNDFIIECVHLFYYKKNKTKNQQ